MNEENKNEKTNPMLPMKLAAGAPRKTDAAEASAPLPASAQQLRVYEVSEALAPAYQRASTLELTEDEINQLTAPFPDDVVEIRPNDGLIYLPHIFISNRLNKVFKPGKWALLRRREWFDEATQTIYGEYILLIRGAYVGESIGGHPYQPNNPKTNYSDALESTAAEALRRICGKRLSCGSQVWEPEYCRKWIKKNAMTKPGRDWKGRPVTVWSRKDNQQEPPETSRGQAPSQDTTPAKKAAAKPQQSVEQWLEVCRTKLFRLLERNLSAAWQFAVMDGWILDNEELTSARCENIFRGVDLSKSIEDNKPIVAQRHLEIMEGIQQIMDGEPNGEAQAKFAAVYVNSDGKVPEDGEQPSEGKQEFPENTQVPRDPDAGQPADDEWWRETPIHFGTNKGITLGELEKNTLYGWWANWEPKPFKGRVSEADRNFRKALDAAGEHYGFKAP